MEISSRLAVVKCQQYHARPSFPLSLCWIFFYFFTFPLSFLSMFSLFIFRPSHLTASTSMLRRCYETKIQPCPIRKTTFVNNCRRSKTRENDFRTFSRFFIDWPRIFVNNQTIRFPPLRIVTFVFFH